MKGSGWVDFPDWISRWPGAPMSHNRIVEGALVCPVGRGGPNDVWDETDLAAARLAYPDQAVALSADGLVLCIGPEARVRADEYEHPAGVAVWDRPHREPDGHLYVGWLLAWPGIVDRIEVWDGTLLFELRGFSSKLHWDDADVERARLLYPDQTVARSENGGYIFVGPGAEHFAPNQRPN